MFPLPLLFPITCFCTASYIFKHNLIGIYYPNFFSFFFFFIPDLIFNYLYLFSYLFSFFLLLLSFHRVPVSIDFIINSLNASNTIKHRSNPKFPCGACAKKVNYNNPSKQCTHCHYWIHV